MKKFFILLSALIFLSYSSIIAKSTNVIGGGIGYGFEIETQAIQFGAVIEIENPIMLATDFKYFLVSDIEGPIDNSWWEINANINYYLIEGRITKFYILSGLQYSNITGTNNLGLNLGCGINFDLGKYNIIPELKYALAGNQQLFIGLSAYFDI